MKRIFAVLFSLCVMAGAAFSKGYNGDVQFHLGAGFDSYVLNIASSGKDFTNTETNSIICFEFDVESWHLFNLNDTVGLGFMAGLDFGVGGISKYEWKSTSKSGGETVPDSGTASRDVTVIEGSCLTGFACGFNVASFLRLNLGLGIAYDFVCRFEKSPAFFSAVGFGFNVQVKFFPQSKVGLVVGYRFAVLGTKQDVSVYNGECVTTNYSLTIYSSDSGISYFDNEIYAGLSINW
ncbi:MAG: hypothetical protein ACI4LX_08445 [Treponema sp.]